MNHQKNEYPKLNRTDFTTCISGGLKRISRRIDAIYRSHLKPFDITVSQLTILTTIGQMWEIEQSELGKVLMMERSTVSRDLKRLVKKGYILQEGRVNKINLMITKEGATFIEKIVPAWEAAMKESRELIGITGEKAIGRIQNKL